MSQRTRILTAVGVLIALVAIVLGVEALRRSSVEPSLAPGRLFCLLGREEVMLSY